MIHAVAILPLVTEAEAARLACRFVRAQGYGAAVNTIAAGRPDDYGVGEANRCIGSRCAHWVAYREYTSTRVKCAKDEYRTITHPQPAGDGWEPSIGDPDPRDLGQRNYDLSTGEAIFYWRRETRGRCGLVLLDMRPVEVRA